MAKFSDKLTQQALASALDAHEAALSKQRELEQARDALHVELQNIEKKMECNSQPFTGGDLNTAAAIDDAVTTQENKRAELEHARDLATRKIRLINTARDRASLDLMTTRPNVAEARAALAAAFERWTLQQPAIKSAIKTLCECCAAWTVALAGQIDAERWAADLLFDHTPTEAQYANARELLRIDDE